MGISLKRFEGWEPKTVTEYVYNDNGQIDHTITTVEPEWDEDETSLMLALHALELDTCSGCNGRLSETTLPENDDNYKVDPPERCHKCTVLSKAADKYTESDAPTALRFIATKRE